MLSGIPTHELTHANKVNALSIIINIYYLIDESTSFICAKNSRIDEQFSFEIKLLFFTKFDSNVRCKSFEWYYAVVCAGTLRTLGVYTVGSVCGAG